MGGDLGRLQAQAVGGGEPPEKELVGLQGGGDGALLGRTRGRAKGAAGWTG